MFYTYNQEEFFKKLGFGEISFDKRFIIVEDYEFVSRTHPFFHRAFKEFLLENIDRVIEIFEDEVRKEGIFFQNFSLLQSLKDLKSFSNFQFMDDMDKYIFENFFCSIFISLDEILKRVEIVNEDLKEEEDMLSKKEYNAAFSEEFSFNLKNYALVKN